MVSTEQKYQGIVFKAAAPSADFTCSTRIVLPGEHTEQDAWARVREALASGEYVGGEVRPHGVPFGVHFSSKR